MDEQAPEVGEDAVDLCVEGRVQAYRVFEWEEQRLLGIRASLVQVERDLKGSPRLLFRGTCLR